MSGQDLVVTTDAGLSVTAHPEEEVSVGTSHFVGILNTMGFTKEKGLLFQDLSLLETIADAGTQADIIDLYEVEPIGFGEVTNMTLPIYGAAIYEFEPGQLKSGTWHERYFQVRLLVFLDDKFRIIKSSGTGLLRHVAYMCRKNGWYIFPAGPVSYKFSWKGAGFPHYLERVNKTLPEL